jgi:hypothetical protein
MLQRRNYSLLSYLRVLQSSPHLRSSPPRTLADLLRRPFGLHRRGKHIRLHP